MQKFWILAGFAILFTLLSCNNITRKSVNHISCSAEKVTLDKTSFLEDSDSAVFFKGGITQSSLSAYSGKFSSLTISGIHPYAFAHTITDVQPDEYIKLSVWRKSKDGSGSLVAALDNISYYYRATSKPVEAGHDGWEKLELEVNIPPHIPAGSDLKVYVWNNGTDSVFFDDFTIRLKSTWEYPEYKGSNFELYLDSSDTRKLLEIRKEAFHAGVLQISEDDWIKSLVVGNEEIMQAKLRLKGDWLDHLYGGKWSYRIKLRKNFSWNRLRTFSLQTPAARDYLMEFVSHKLYQNNDVLTTRYGFIPLKINGKSRGLYAWEEHMVKQLPEYNKRREGPIIKFAEDPFWQIQKMNIHNKSWPVFPFYETAVIEPFSESKTINSPTLFMEFKSAQKLLQQYREGVGKPDDIFDLNKLARYYALMDLTHARHGMTWHNQRFYYNPVIQKLEPIAFDGYVSEEAIDLTVNDNFAKQVLLDKNDRIDKNLFLFLFMDSTFMSKYLENLYELSAAVYADSMTRLLQPEVSYYDSLLRIEYPYYYYDYGWIVKSAEAIREYLPALEPKLWNAMSTPKQPLADVITYTDSTVYEDTPAYFLNAYKKGRGNHKDTIEIHQYFPAVVNIYGTGPESGFIFSYLDEPLKMSPYRHGLDGIVRTIVTDTTAEYLFFGLSGSDKVYSVPIKKWPFPDGKTSRQKLALCDWKLSPLIDHIDQNTVYIKQDSLKTHLSTIIPKGYVVRFLPGTSIDLTNDAYFMSWSPVKMEGTANQPISIYSSDFTARGFTVLQADEPSMVVHTSFINLNTFYNEDWMLTGAVSFYESNVTFDHISIYRNQCEDALNIVRSSFKLLNSSFELTFGDAFDADFSKGLVFNTSFFNIGNDAIDFSGSLITIDSCLIRGANDKGVSGGEESTLKLKNVTIERANIGVASKDLSILEVSDCTISECNYGLVLLQKKPEYGPASMVLNHTKIFAPQKKFLIEKGSWVMIDGKRINGTIEDLAKQFY